MMSVLENDECEDYECEDGCKDDCHLLDFFTEIHVGDPLAGLCKLLVSE